MNHTKASCGHMVIAVGAPGSMARLAVENRHCGLPRCGSGLPGKFSDRECAAYVWLVHRCIGGWTVDRVDKGVLAVSRKYPTGLRWNSLIEFAKTFHWEG